MTSEDNKNHSNILIYFEQKFLILGLTNIFRCCGVNLWNPVSVVIHRLLVCLNDWWELLWCTHNASVSTVLGQSFISEWQFKSFKICFRTRLICCLWKPSGNPKVAPVGKPVNIVKSREVIPAVSGQAVQVVAFGCEGRGLESPNRRSTPPLGRGPLPEDWCALLFH